jgi:dTDP-4-dehydrorhamnose 3,5-epimerase
MDAVTDIENVQLVPLRIIAGENGKVLHAMRASALGFAGFGEAYFSTVDSTSIKGWKKHQRMVLNIVVPVGEIQFILLDDRPGSTSCGQVRSITLGDSNYQRLSVPPGIWMAFAGRSTGTNMLLNMASIEHDPQEALTLPVDHAPFKRWLENK